MGKKLFVKFIIMSLLLILLSQFGYCFSLLGVHLFGKKHTEIVAKKSVETKKTTKVNTELNAIKNLSATVDKLMEIAISNSMKITGIDNSLTNTVRAGRDAINQITDPNLMKSIFMGIVIVAIFFFLLIGVFMVLIFNYLKWKTRSYKIKLQGNRRR